MTKTCPQCGTQYEQDIKFCPRDGSALRAPSEDGSLVGTVLAGRYDVLQRLGAGAMGEVYLAEHVKMGRPCAIKVMNRLLAADHEAIARFNREAANASRINHPNVAAIYDFGETPDGLIFLAMEFIDGEPLSELIAREGPLYAGRAAWIGRQIADALVAAHDLGIVHRDLKPDNIMMTRTRDGRDMVKVVDFGIAKAPLAGGQEVTRTGFVVGTPEYMSPEQFVGIAVDARSDVYAVGCILYKMLTGQVAYPGRVAEGRLRERIGEPPPRPSEANPRVPKTLDTLVMRAMSFEPDDRFQSAADLRDALALEQDSPSQTRRAVRIVRVSRRAWFAAGATAGVAILVALGMSARPENGTPPAAVVPADTARAIDTVAAGVDAGAPSAPDTSAPAARSVAAPVTRPPDESRRSELEARLSRAQQRALDANTRAVAAGASPSELRAGAALVSRAERERTAQRLPSAIATLEEAARTWDDAAGRARARAESATVRRTTPTITQTAEIQPPAPVAGPPRVATTDTVRPPVVSVVPSAPVDPAPEIRAVLQRYARALASRDIAQLRRAYPGLTAEEERRWRDVFDATEAVSATLTVGAPTVIGDSASVSVAAAYGFDFKRGVSGDRAPHAAYRATLRREQGEWRLIAIR